MKSTKKIAKTTLPLIVAALMVTSFVGCGKSADVSNNSADTSSKANVTSNVQQSTKNTASSVQRVESKDNDFDYSISDFDSNTYMVHGYEGTDANVYNIPAEYKGKNVTGISFNAFMGKDVIEVNIPDSVTYIGEMAFYSCSSLEKVTMGSAVETIEKNTFMECTALKEIVLPDTLKEISVGTFQDCSSLEKVTIGNGVTDIQEIAFANCSALKEVHMGNSVLNIEGDNVFANCDNLTIYAPAGSYAESFAKENNISFVAEWVVTK